MTSDRVAQRFWARVERRSAGECWPWLGTVSGRYGQFSIGRRTIGAHRVAYSLTKGPIPRGLTIDHLCREPLCMNPGHLEAVTNRVNILRGVGPTAVNAQKDQCHNGHPFSPSNTTQRRDGKRECRSCNRARQARDLVRAHAKRTADGSGHACPRCSRVLPTNRSLGNHLARTHLGELTHEELHERRRASSRAASARHYQRRLEALRAEQTVAAL